MEPPTESPGAELKNDEHQQEAEKEDATKAAPQSQDANESATAEVSHQDSMQSYEDEMVDCKLTPTDIHNQRQNLKDVLNSETTPTLPPPLKASSASSTTNNNNNNNGGSSSLLHASEDHQNQNHHVQFADDTNNNNTNNQQQHQSALHQDEYSQYNNNNNGEYNPNNHESALASSSSGGHRGINKNNNNDSDGNRFKGRKKNRLVPDGRTGKKGCSHPRKSPYRSEVARLRHAQQQLEHGEGQQRGNTNGNTEDGITDFTDVASVTSQKSTKTLKDTTAPPDTSSFAIQSSKFKHSLLNSLGEFLTSAFADDEEASGSYFSQDLLDQLSSSNPHLKGVWLQAKSLNDTHVQQLCDALIRNKVVTEVWLPNNAITDVGAAYIAHMLKFNTTIKELFLGGNDIGPKGAAALAGALARGNTTLVALGLGDNHIGVEGAGAFAAALRHNHSLHTLDIKKNGISKKSSIRGLLNKMLEFNASDPGDETLVMGLQEELANLVSTLPSDMAEHVVLQAEEALKMAMLCRRRGDKVGAAEAEGIFIRICTTGEPPVDPPEEMSVAVEERRSSGKRAATKVRQQKQQQQRDRNREPLDVDEGKEEEKPGATEQQEKEGVVDEPTKEEESSVPDANVESAEKETSDDGVVEESVAKAKLEEEESNKRPEEDEGETKNEQQAKEIEEGGKEEEEEEEEVEDNEGQDEKSETVEDSTAAEGEAVSDEAK